MRVALLALVPLLGGACGGGAAKRPAISKATTPVARTAGDRILPLLPEGAQLIVELDFARLRANPVVGKLVTQALTGPNLPMSSDIPMSPLANVDALVLASYGMGTSQAATVTVLVTKDSVPNGVSVGEGLVALGPELWTAQLEARAAIAGVDQKLTASRELLELRDHSMPPGAPGAALRITARLSFDARVALARQTGLDAPPGRISIWGDVVDDLAIIVDADAVDPGDKKSKQPTKRLETGVRGMLAGLASEPAIRALGIPSSLHGARIVAKGSWVRTIIAIGPAHLQRVVQRADAMLSSQAPPSS
ncbi:MAG: hypothetical protein H0T46_19545 [Deltaproteobacteria bacterium]|nr:hypothetical protein [Deltaproteobacteria bacterium]